MNIKLTCPKFKKSKEEKKCGYFCERVCVHIWVHQVNDQVIKQKKNRTVSKLNEIIQTLPKWLTTQKNERTNE